MKLTKVLADRSGLRNKSIITADDLIQYDGISPYAFADCNLISITIPDTIKCINRAAFRCCTHLESVTLPNTLINIKEEAFKFCTRLTSITIPNSVKFIGSYAFSQCPNLKSITILSDVLEIGLAAFSRTINLTQVHISNLSAWCNIRFFDAFSNPLHFAHHLYLNGTEITNLVIPKDIKMIKAFAFYSSSIKSVTIPDSVFSIESNAFSSCSNLVEVNLGKGIQFIGSAAFSHCKNLSSIKIPESIQTIGRNAFKYCDFSLTIKRTGSKIIAYKAFNKDMTCRGFQYEEGKTYELGTYPILCERGFHACLNPLDCFNYNYYGNLSYLKFHTVYLEDVVFSNAYLPDSKVAAGKITIGRPITVQEMAKIASRA